MTTYAVRVWLPDRPGALGAVASRIGAVRGDLVGIEILERGGGRAIDELLVQLPGDDLLPLLVAEISQVDGVDVEDVRLAAESVHNPRLGGLEAAAVLVEQYALDGLFTALCAHARHTFDADWSVLLDLDGPGLLASAGEAPPATWLGAFLHGSRTSAAVVGADAGPDDVAWAELPTADLALVLGRQGRPFRAQERRQLLALARIADSRRIELVARQALATQPGAAR
ncbi:MAG TPA: hypothetical protein VHM89_08910 [Acidimicrobiales bacterium]|nr:hypothetical protein [Acidimicrobiales bacterium]